MVDLSIAMLNYQRVYPLVIKHENKSMTGCQQGSVAARSAAFMDPHGIFSFEHMVMLTNKWRFHQL